MFQIKLGDGDQDLVELVVAELLIQLELEVLDKLSQQIIGGD